MSLNVKKLVKKISGLFKEEEPERTYLIHYKPVKCPQMGFRREQRDAIKQQPPSREIENLQWQIGVMKVLEARIDETAEDEVPIKRDHKRATKS